MSGNSSSEKLQIRNAIAMLLVFYIGNGGIFAATLGLGPDGWIAQLLGFAIAIPLFLILGRLMRLMPGMDFFEMLNYTFGRALAVFVSILYLGYFLMLSSTVWVYAEFIRLVNLPNTPLLVILLVFFTVCVYLAESGVLTAGRWSVFLAAILIFVAVTLTLFAVSGMRMTNLLPVAADGGKAVVRGGLRFAISPFGEAVAVLAVIGIRLDKEASPYKLFFVGGMIALAFFVLNFLRDLAILGAVGMDSMHFPSYKVAGVIQMGSIGARVEFLAVLPFLLAGLTKTAICLMAAAKVARRIVPRPPERCVMISLAFVSLILASIWASNLGERTGHFHVAPVFQFGIPAVMWIVAEVKGLRKPMGAVG